MKGILAIVPLLDTCEDNNCLDNRGRPRHNHTLRYSRRLELFGNEELLSYTQILRHLRMGMLMRCEGRFSCGHTSVYL